jgi:hypothetical protein
MPIARIHPNTPAVQAALMARRLGCVLKMIDGRVWLWRNV